VVGGGIAEASVFGVVGNLGSLAARILFQPIEETARAHFSKIQGNLTAF